MQLAPELQTKLMQLVQRGIKSGEKLLLARLIADRIPVGTTSNGKPWEVTLAHRNSVDSVLFTLNEYMHINKDDRESLYGMIDRIWAWRKSVASGQSTLLFSGETDKVVDDFSGVMRFALVNDVCPLMDMVNDANYMYDLFKQVVQSTWSAGG